MLRQGKSQQSQAPETDPHWMLSIRLSDREHHVKEDKKETHGEVEGQSENFETDNHPLGLFAASIPF